MVSKPSRYFRFSSKSEFKKIINLNQFVVKREFFIKNFNNFKNYFKGKEIDIINEKNTAFIDIPLVAIEYINKTNLKALNKLDKKSIDKAFQINFLYRLYSLIHRKKLIFDPYLYKLILFGLGRNKFIMNYLKESIFSRDYLTRLKKEMTKSS